MDNEYDFQTGDKVYCLVFGKGVVIAYNMDITVQFEGDFICTYNEKGALYEIDINKNEYELDYLPNRTLYHAGTKIDITENIPLRHEWINIYQNNKGEVKTAGPFKTKTDAVSFYKQEIELSKFSKKAFKYIKTVELKAEKEE